MSFPSPFAVPGGHGGVILAAPTVVWHIHSGSALTPKPCRSERREDLDVALRRLRDHASVSARRPCCSTTYDGRWKDVKIAYVDDPDGFVIDLIHATA
jgi:hypothetical protein